MNSLSDPLAGLINAAGSAMQSRNFEAAAGLLGQALDLDGTRLDLWLSLAAAHRAFGALDQALEAANGALRLEPRHFQALLLRASLLERLQGERAAAPIYGAAILQAPDEARLDAPTLRTLAHARRVNEGYGVELNAALRGGIDGLSLSSTAAKRAGIFVDLLTGRRRNYRQEPLGYFYPGLPAVEFWSREHFPWIDDLEDCAPQIVREMRSIGFDNAGLTPYIDFSDLEPLDQWAELNRSSQWTALHLYQHGRRLEENCARCPATLTALASIDQPVADNRSPSSMFSILQPHTRIPPHTGVANTRLVAHLALIVPSNCGFRVGAETRAWREGEAWVFDDTIEHEAWNDSDQGRAVLIFDVWNPLIPPEEREAISVIMSGMDEFAGVTALDR